MSIGTIFLLVFTANIHAQMSGSKVIRFEDLPKLVRDRNENVKAAESIHLAQKERSGYFTRSFLPKVSAKAGNETFKTDSARTDNQNYWMLEGKVNLYRGGRDRLEEKVREANENIAKSQLSHETIRELTEARQTYWKLVGISKLIKDRREALGRNESHIKSSRRRSGAGISTNADTIQFELHETTLQQELKKMTLQQDLLRNRLSVAIGWDEHENLQVAEDFPHPPDNKEMFPKLNGRENIELKIASERQARELARSQQHQRWWLPQVDAYTSYGVPSLSDEFTRAIRNEKEWTAGLKVGLDLGEAFESRHEARAKAFEAQAEKNRANHRLREVIAADHELRHDLSLLHELIHDADKDITKAETFLKLTNSEYARGVKNGPDLLGAFQSLYEFRQRRTTLYQEYHETLAELTALLAKEEES